MIPQFSVTLTNDYIVDISFINEVPEELVVLLKEKLLEAFSGCEITPSSVQQMGNFANGVVTDLVNKGVLFKDPTECWRLKST